MITWIRECFTKNEILYTKHARDEMEHEEFGEIIHHEVSQIVNSGKIIEEYSDDEPYPSCLIYGTTGQRRPLHVSMCLFKRRELGYNYRCLSTGSPEVDGL